MVIGLGVLRFGVVGGCRLSRFGSVVWCAFWVWAGFWCLQFVCVCCGVCVCVIVRFGWWMWLCCLFDLLLNRCDTVVIVYLCVLIVLRGG